MDINERFEGGGTECPITCLTCGSLLDFRNMSLHHNWHVEQEKVEERVENLRACVQELIWNLPSLNAYDSRRVERLLDGCTTH